MSHDKIMKENENLTPSGTGVNYTFEDYGSIWKIEILKIGN